MANWAENNIDCLVENSKLEVTFYRLCLEIPQGLTLVGMSFQLLLCVETYVRTF